MTNELKVQEKEIKLAEQGITKDENGKYKRQASYDYFSSVNPETREQKIAMIQLLDSDDVAIPMKEALNKTISVADVITNPYTSLDEDTGELTNGVLTYLIDQEGNAYVTSSKSVYFSLQTIIKVLGEPHWSVDEAVNVKVVEKKGRQFKFVDIVIVA